MSRFSTLLACVLVAGAATARIVAHWPIDCDPATGLADGRCEISRANDLHVADVAAFCTLPSNRTAVLTRGGPGVADFAYSTSVGHYVTPTNDFTIEGWYHFSELPAPGEAWKVVSAHARTDCRWFLTLRNENRHPGLTWQIFSALPNTGDSLLTTVTDSATLTNGWHHFALSFDHRTEAGMAEWVFYLDGTRVGSRSVPAFAGVWTGDGRFGLGGRGTPGDVIHGSLSDCCLSDEVLVPARFLMLRSTLRGDAPQWQTTRDLLANASLKPITVEMPPSAWYRDPANIHYQTGPSIAVAPGGRIWVAIMTGGVTEENRNYVDLLTSGDGGATWSEPKLALDIEGPLRTFDPAMWTDPLGRVWLFWCQVYDFWDGRGGLWAMVCEHPDDENATWSAPRRLCDGVMKDKPLVCRNGDWWLFVEQWQPDTAGGNWDRIKDDPPAWYHADTPHIGANVYRSRNRGETWSYFSTAPVPTDVRTCDEHMAIEREDGTFRMLLRAKYGLGECTSSNGGAGWTMVAPSAIKNPPARFFFGKLKSGNVLLVKNGPLTVQTGRRDIIAYLSEDDGATFPYKLELDMRDLPSYPDVAQGADGTFYSVHDYDRTGVGEILLDVFTEDDIRAGRLVSPQSVLHRMVRRNAPR